MNKCKRSSPDYKTHTITGGPIFRLFMIWPPVCMLRCPWRKHRTLNYHPLPLVCVSVCVCVCVCVCACVALWSASHRSQVKAPYKCSMLTIFLQTHINNSKSNHFIKSQTSEETDFDTFLRLITVPCDNQMVAFSWRTLSNVWAHFSSSAFSVLASGRSSGFSHSIDLMICFCKKTEKHLLRSL